MNDFEHERLEVYKVAVELVVLIDKVTKMFGPARAYMAEQLQRGTTSLTLYVASGADAPHDKEKLECYRQAQRLATESAALLDLSRALKVADEKQLAAGRGMLLKIVQMLDELGQDLEGQPRKGKKDAKQQDAGKPKAPEPGKGPAKESGEEEAAPAKPVAKPGLAALLRSSQGVAPKPGSDAGSPAPSPIPPKEQKP